jgi:hypothetical protein
MAAGAGLSKLMILLQQALCFLVPFQQVQYVKFAAISTLRQSYMYAWCRHAPLGCLTVLHRVL